jgi:hypothetical protein
METRERPHHPQLQPVAPGTPDAADLTATRADAERLMDAADAAIERALSTDSAAFLAATRQRGGQ